MEKFITLKQLKMAVHAVLTKINSLRPDWNENNPENSNYIQNRTHYKEIEYETFTFNSDANYESESNSINNISYSKSTLQAFNLNNFLWYDFAFDENNIIININGTTYNNLEKWTENNGYVLFYNNDIGIKLNKWSDIDYVMDITVYHNLNNISSLSVSVPRYVYHKLDNKYINGKFITEGTGNNSEIFNDVTSNIASGDYSHAEGFSSIASGNYSHAEGTYTTASSESSHAEGSGSTASAWYAHAEGYNTNASGQYSHAEGSITTASGNYSHAEGYNTKASGQYSHAENYYTYAAGNYSHADGYYASAQRRSQHVFGEYNILDTTGSTSSAKGSFIEIVGNGTGSSARSNARTLDWSGNEVLAGKLTVGTGPTANMDVATKQYVDTATIGITEIPTNWINGAATGSIRSKGSTEENSTYSLGTHAIAEGYQTAASGSYSHAEGLRTISSNQSSHAEGTRTIASGLNSHAEGGGLNYSIKLTGNANATTYTVSNGPILRKNLNASRLEINSLTAVSFTIDSTGKINSITLPNTLNANNSVNTNYTLYVKTSASGDSSHAEGGGALSNGAYSHAGGNNTLANGSSSFAHGENVIANVAAQTVFGKYNIEDNSSAFIIGNGTSSAFSNAYTLDWNGNGVYTGKLTVGAGPTNNMDVATKQYVDTATAGITSNLSGLTDTTITNPTEGQILTYDSTSSKWVNSAISITNTLESGILIATINGVNIYAPSYVNGDNLSYGGNE